MISIIVFILTSCGGSSSGKISSNSIAINAVTIDNAGRVPLLNGLSTTSVIYVHNNSNVAVNGIKYSSTTSNFIDQTSANLCSTIQANQACPLKFTTPTPSDNNTQGSTLLTLSYQKSGKTVSFSQIINYKVLQIQMKVVYYLDLE